MTNKTMNRAELIQDYLVRDCAVKTISVNKQKGLFNKYIDAVEVYYIYFVMGEISSNKIRGIFHYCKIPEESLLEFQIYPLNPHRLGINLFVEIEKQECVKD
jgi:hypothetical protein